MKSIRLTVVALVVVCVTLGAGCASNASKRNVGVGVSKTVGKKPKVSVGASRKVGKHVNVGASTTIGNK